MMQACADAASAEGYTRLELVATLPGKPLYVAMGYTVTARLAIPMGEGLTLPAALMHKEGTRCNVERPA
jgi:hypothetical protein